MTYTFADPKEYLFQITPKIRLQLWQQSQVYSNPSSRWRAYINQVCLHGFLDWVQAEYDIQAKVWKSSANFPSFWEFVNGTAVFLNGKKIVLIPTEAIDDSELEVPQEWVDIPSWAADFYLAVQIKPDDEYIRFWGYTTHQELKKEADYDPVDRTYCMDSEHITKSLNAFWIAYEFCQPKDTRATVSKLPLLSTTQPENILQRLTSSSTIFPRLEIPFHTWGALLEKEDYRQRLYQLRQNPVDRSQAVNLSDWFQGIYKASWKALDDFLNLDDNNLAFNFRSTVDSSAANVKRAKVIDLGTEAEPQKVLLVIELIPSLDQNVAIRVQLHPLDSEYLPSNTKLLLKQSTQIIQEVQARLQDNCVQLKLFQGEVGECFSIQVILNSSQITEDFMI